MLPRMLVWSGLYGATNGANTATSTIAATTQPPTLLSRGMPLTQPQNLDVRPDNRGSPRPGSTVLNSAILNCLTDTRVDRRLQNVRRESCDDNDSARQERDGLYNGIVAVLDRLDQE